ncbi:MAG TPA: Rieske 2Fe-2S domain-containing protein [Limnochordia bacterium]
MALPAETPVRGGFRKVADLGELKQKGCLVVKGGRYGVALFYHEGEVYAVDNRCPHLGFPLHLGTVCDGLLTCHWHHARFDLKSGGTLDPWADDVPTYPVVVRDGSVWINTEGKDAAAAPDARWLARLEEGLEQNLNLVIAKAVVALLEGGVPVEEIVRRGAAFGLRYRRAGWGPGLTILTAMTGILPRIAAEDRALALFHGLVHVARDAAGSAPRFGLQPLANETISLSRLKGWFRRLVEVRDADGAERVLLTALSRGATPQKAAEILFSAATDHVYLSGGHTLDFINKAFELLDHIGWEAAPSVLPSVARLLPAASRSEEQAAWRHPVDLVALCERALERLGEEIEGLDADAPPLAAAERDELLVVLLGDDPLAIAGALEEALRAGTSVRDLARTLAYAAAARIARFHTENEFSDWIAVLHTFSYSNALHCALHRAPCRELVRGLFHGAMRIYLDRFLNVPPAPLPWERPASRSASNGAGEDHLAAFLDRLQARHQVEAAAAIAAEHLAAGGDHGALLRTYGRALLREDAEFHTFQMVEAGFAQHAAWAGEAKEQALILIAIARYLAAHAPTPRELPHVARVAARLHRGERLYEERSAADVAV